MVVATNMRGKSFGSLLTQHLVDLAKELGVYKLSLECFDNLITFYEKAGFRRDGNSFMVQRFD